MSVTVSSYGDPKGRYPDSLRSFPFGGTSAIHGYGWLNLGHVEDDESNLIYMRARYYDPTSGRFISEDPSRDGQNWFAYCNSNPQGNEDPTGESAKEIERIFRAMPREGDITREELKLLMDRSNGVRDIIHRIISKKHYSDEEIKDIIRTELDIKESGKSLETTDEIEADMEAGVDAEEILLEEEVEIIDSTGA